MQGDSPALVTSQTQRGILVLTIVSTVVRDADTSYALRDQARELLGSNSPDQVVIDLCNLTSIGSMGFLVFMSLRRQVGDGRIVLCNLSDIVKDMFRTCQLISDVPGKAAPFEVADTLDDALAKLCG